MLRADGDSQMGMGHVMRCLALGQAWQDAGGRVAWAMAAIPSALVARLKSEGMEVFQLAVHPGSADDARETAKLARRQGAGWVIVDGYHFDAGYQRLIKDSGLRLLFVDDYGHAAHYCADIVLNQNIYAHEGLYYPSKEPHTRLLLGTCYALLREEFLRWRGWQREVPEIARKILVTLGGADPDNATSKVIKALELVEIEGLEARVVVGEANPHDRELRLLASPLRSRIQIKSKVADMSELMAWAEAAVTAGGSTCWESAFMGLPSILIILSDDQRPIAQKLGAMGVAMNLGWHKYLTSAQVGRSLENLLTCEETRASMGRRGRELVDGEGGARVVEALLN